MGELTGPAGYDQPNMHGPLAGISRPVSSATVSHQRNQRLPRRASVSSATIQSLDSVNDFRLYHSVSNLLQDTVELDTLGFDALERLEECGIH